MASNNPSTSSDAQTPDANDEVNTMTTVRIPYIILNDIAEVVEVDEVMKEAKNINAVDFNTVQGTGVYHSLNRSRMTKLCLNRPIYSFLFHISCSNYDFIFKICFVSIFVFYCIHKCFI